MVFDDADHDPIMILLNKRSIDHKSIDKLLICVICCEIELTIDRHRFSMVLIMNLALS